MVDLKPCPFCGNRLERSDALSTRGNDVFVHPVSDDDDLCVTQFVIGSSDGRRVAAWNRRADPCGAALEAQLAERVKEPLDEGLEILTNFIDSVQRHGNYSKESTCTFIDQSASCIREALSALEPTPPAPKDSGPTRVYEPYPGAFDDILGPDTPPAPSAQCERCQGNGEIVTDWERYLHPHDGDVGDEAVAECPDCSGYGTSDDHGEDGTPPAPKVTECATEGCEQPAGIHFIRGDVGSHYCIECYKRVQRISLAALLGDAS